ncbi:MAG: type II toxin-antitoxin system RelE/ParE family toxin [Helicobacteraceae bacterium]|jgi:mRNA-degrading endonuclease RelE of RelBE toxin-antitoxin system|nr:type II toxin-antitoxin system RelE/ParE family toxin [Helicobacteraceae bacterium]
MPLKIIYTPAALRDLKKIGAEAAGIVERIGAYAQTQQPAPKALKGKLKGLYRLRFGDRRVVFELNDGVMTIAYIDRRDKVYKR